MASYYEHLRNSMDQIKKLSKEVFHDNEEPDLDKISNVFGIDIPQFDINQIDYSISQIITGELIKNFIILLASKAAIIPTVKENQSTKDSYGMLNCKLILAENNEILNFADIFLNDLKMKLLDDSVSYFSSLKQNSKELKVIKDDFFFEAEKFYQVRLMLNQSWKEYFYNIKDEIYSMGFDYKQFHENDFESNYTLIKNEDKVRYSMPIVNFPLLEYASKLSNIKINSYSSKKITLIKEDKMTLKVLTDSTLATIDTQKALFINQLNFNNFLTVVKDLELDEYKYTSLGINPSLSIYTYNKLTHNVDLYFLVKRYWEDHFYFQENFNQYLDTYIDKEIPENSYNFITSKNLEVNSSKLLNNPFYLTAISYSKSFGCKHYLISKAEDAEWFVDLNIWETLDKLIEILSFYIKELIKLKILEKSNDIEHFHDNTQSIESQINTIIYKGLKHFNPYENIIKEINYQKPLISIKDSEYAYYATLHQKVYSYTKEHI
ncbi:hypothetical protein [Planococcus salinarum]|uniref:hypothetical protein n=1 Tax=Planococcus salinarum TaxID=622695 RepID=UPI000E3D8920|nr:hypothetical protein [Planococcus salinarum]TAA73149.1 hypothetical protein D2909_02210 [Planococcus salinarum]